MALIAKQQASVTGLNPVVLAACAGGGDTVAIDGNVYIEIRNGSGGSLTATFVVPGTTYGQANPDVPVAIAAAATAIIGPIPREWTDANGLLSITYSGVTSLTIAAIRG